jgi:hypothetical protein
MLRKTLLTLSASTMLGAAAIASNAALAQPFPGPPAPAGGAPLGPPGGGLAGPPRPGGPPGPRTADLPRPPGVGGGNPGLHGGQGNFYGRSGTYAYGHTGVYGRTTNYSYYGSNYGYYGYGQSGYAYGSWRHHYWAPYGVYIYSNSSSSDCYYTYKYGYRLSAYRRVRVCSENPAQYRGHLAVARPQPGLQDDCRLPTRQ